MRIAIWNCNMAFRKKAHAILATKPDLLIVPECECPERLVFTETSHTPQHALWVGDNPHKGISIFAYTDRPLQLHPAYNPAIKYAVPVLVGGSFPFILIALWAMPDQSDPLNSYVGRVWAAVNTYAHLFGQPIVIAGDFNWNIIWDREKHSPSRKLISVINLLQSQGISSLYHTFFTEPFGQETQPTLYLYRKQNRPYHVDYIFASAEFGRSLRSVEVGAHEQWNHLSDHMPIIATFEIPSKSQTAHQAD